mgnify:CR=1 FL=1|jgi:HD superfamily phosphohydrolase YqeK
MDYTHIEEYVASQVSKRRYNHCISTASEAQMLLERYKPYLELSDDAYLAGLWHDSCREWQDVALLAYCDQHELAFSCLERRFPMLLHGLVASETIRAYVPQVSTAVCLAIRWHTLGSKDMGVLGAAIYAADYMEPLRAHLGKGEREELLCSDTLESLCLAIITRHLDHVSRRDKKPAESTLDLADFLVKGGQFT